MSNGIFGMKATRLDEAIDDILEKMSMMDSSSDDYITQFSYLERLSVLKAAEGRNKISPDTLAIVVGNLAGILIVVGYEQGHVIVSRALGFLLRTKIQ